MIGSLFYDLRYGARGLRKSPGYSVSAGLTLALSLGGTVAMSGVAYAALFRPLPFADESRLFRLQMSTEPAGRGVLTGLPPHAFGRLREQVLRREGLTLGLGTAAGLAGALLVTRLMSGLVVEAAPPGAGPLAGAVALLAFVTALAAYLPVRRAARIHPMSALRGE